MTVKYVPETYFEDEPYLDEYIVFDTEQGALGEYAEYEDARVIAVPVGDGENENTIAEFANTVSDGCILDLNSIEILHKKGELVFLPEWFTKKNQSTKDGE